MAPQQQLPDTLPIVALAVLAVRDLSTFWLRTYVAQSACPAPSRDGYVLV
jgi:hypothetical protein